ncbi:hypothetical protein OROMI_003757 [Orobanche minor]
MGILSNRVEKDEIKGGDHIYTYLQGYLCLLSSWFLCRGKQVEIRAMYLLQNGFGNYDVLFSRIIVRNFALYCSTSLLTVDRLGVGRSGQASSVISAPLVVPLYDEVSPQNVSDVTVDWTMKPRQMLRNKKRERKLFSFADLVGKHHGEIVAVVIGTMRSLMSFLLK